MNRYWSKLAGSLDPYVPGEQPKDKKYIKLNTNENPYGPSPRVLEAIRMSTDSTLRLYPDATCSQLLSAASEYYGIDQSQIFPGNGSDEILAFSFLAFFDPDREILFPNITYTFYPVYANLFKMKYRLIKLGKDFDLPIEELYNGKGGVIIANPNAPTGKALSLEAIKKVLENNSSAVVIVDEAYIDFGGESAVKLINEYPNLLVIHTFSKSRSLAGMRLGFALGDSGLIEAMNNVKNSFNSYTVDRLAIAAGVEAFRDTEYFESTRKKVMATRERVIKSLREIGFNVCDSDANFVFAGHLDVNAEVIFKGLREKGILVRYFKKPVIDNYLRISIGTDDEMDCLLKEIRELIRCKN